MVLPKVCFETELINRLKLTEREGFASDFDAADCNMVKKLQLSAVIARHLLSKDQASKSCVSFCLRLTSFS